MKHSSCLIYAPTSYATLHTHRRHTPRRHESKLRPATNSRPQFRQICNCGVLDDLCTIHLLTTTHIRFCLNVNMSQSIEIYPCVDKIMELTAFGAELDDLDPSHFGEKSNFDTIRNQLKTAVQQDSDFTFEENQPGKFYGPAKIECRKLDTWPPDNAYIEAAKAIWGLDIDPTKHSLKDVIETIIRSGMQDPKARPTNIHKLVRLYLLGFSTEKVRSIDIYKYANVYMGI